MSRHRPSQTALSSRPQLVTPKRSPLPGGTAGKAFRKEERETQCHIATSQRADNTVKFETVGVHKSFRHHMAAITCDITGRSLSVSFRWKRALIKPLIPIASAYHAITGVFSPLWRRASNAPSPVRAQLARAEQITRVKQSQSVQTARTAFRNTENNRHPESKRLLSLNPDQTVSFSCNSRDEEGT